MQANNTFFFSGFESSTEIWEIFRGEYKKFLLFDSTDLQQREKREMINNKEN